MRAPISAFAAILLLLPGAALARGKVGLWAITSSTRINSISQVAPDTAAALRRRLPASSNGAYLALMCMTPVDVDTDTPPRVTDRSIDCRTRVLKKTAAVMNTETICYGPVAGVSHTQFVWSGDEHYSASYRFHGKIRGEPRDFDATFSGDWTSPDCGGVKPFIPQER
ncbi:MAG TPA: DUF3617 family protein [Rhizomicrobium sp.]